MRKKRKKQLVTRRLLVVKRKLQVTKRKLKVMKKEKLPLKAKRMQVEARRLQAIVAKADWVAIQTGFAGVKAALQHFKGYGGEPRKPCGLPSGEQMNMITNGFEEVMTLEQSLA